MKTALVTGANKGIGREVAQQLAAKGFYVFVGARNRKAGGKAAGEIGKHGGKAAFLELDVSDDSSVTAAAREFSRLADHLDVLVNNAGIIVDGDDGILKISDELLRETLETNTLGGRWSVDGRRGGLGARLLHFENCSEWRDVSIGGGTSEICSEFGLSGLGADGHGRIERNEIR